MKVYLGGPIFNVTRQDATTWRAEACKKFKDLGIKAVDPNRRPYIPGQEDEIVMKDLEEIRKADVLLAHVPENTAMAGTPMEIFYAAWVLRIPVYTFPRNPSPWIVKWSTKQFDTLDDTVAHIESQKLTTASV